MPGHRVEVIDRTYAAILAAKTPALPEKYTETAPMPMSPNN